MPGFPVDGHIYIYIYVSLAACNPPCTNGECVSPDICNFSEGWMGNTCSEGNICCMFSALIFHAVVNF